MIAFWIRFKNAKPACAYVENEAEARRLAEPRGTIEDIRTLPHPARPRLDDRDGWDHKKGECPSFCYAPEKCAVTGHCPNHRSCTE